MAPPLAGVRVIAVEQYGAGPWATLQFADLGAEVIKIEDPASAGDVGRYVPPFQEGEDSLFFETFNRNKLSVSLDLRTPAGREVFRDLTRNSDVVFSNLRGDLSAKLGLRYDDLAEVNHAIVCCSLSGFGSTGPRAAEAGYDYLIQGLAGWMSLTGPADAPPMKSGLSIVDFSAGYAAAFATIAALWRARETGVGCDCDISLFETALHQLTYLATWSATRGYVPERLDDSAHPSIVPFQNMPTRDGWIVVACPKEKFWRNLCAALGSPELGDDERFLDFERRRQNREPLLEILKTRFRERATSEWLEVLAAHDVPCASVNDVGAALADPQSEARGAVVAIEHPRFGTVREVASPLRLSGEHIEYRRAPQRGEHQHDVLGRVCNYNDAMIERYAASGAFGPSSAPPPLTTSEDRL